VSLDAKFGLLVPKIQQRESRIRFGWFSKSFPLNSVLRKRHGGAKWVCCPVGRDTTFSRLQPGHPDVLSQFRGTCEAAVSFGNRSSSEVKSISYLSSLTTGKIGGLTSSFASNA
jgi:hypothetical protein